jgi:TANFOR domain-containing protein
MRRVFCACFGTILVGTALASAPVTVTTVVSPPYSTYLSDYVTQPGRLRVRLQNNTADELKVRLLVKVYCLERGIRISSDSSYRPAQPLVLPANSTTEAGPSYLKHCFSAGSIIMEGVDREQLLRGNGLPQGRYRVSVRALNYDDGAPLSDAEPAGSSGWFEVVQYEPATIITPRNGAEILPTLPQNIVFTWNRTPSVPPARILEYRLRLVELVPDTRDPSEAIASTPPVFEKALRNQTAYVYGPADPPLKPGVRYAARVDVRDIERPGGFRNNGRSEVTAFRFGKVPLAEAETSAEVSVPPALLKVKEVRLRNTGRDTVLTDMSGEYRMQLFADSADEPDAIDFVFDGILDYASVQPGVNLVVQTDRGTVVAGEVKPLDKENGVRLVLKPLGADLYKVVVAGSGDCPVRSTDGRPLDGEPEQLPSGDGKAGGDFWFELFVK